MLVGLVLCNTVLLSVVEQSKEPFCVSTPSFLPSYFLLLLQLQLQNTAMGRRKGRSISAITLANAGRQGKGPWAPKTQSSHSLLHSSDSLFCTRRHGARVCIRVKSRTSREHSDAAWMAHIYNFISFESKLSIVPGRAIQICFIVLYINDDKALARVESTFVFTQ